LDPLKRLTIITTNNTNHKNYLIILAGGLGTRLQSIVKNVPKPMADVNGKPFLSFLLDYWITHNINHFVISVGYLGHIIMDYFKESYRGVPIQYIVENEPLGTGGAVKKILTSIQNLPENITLVNGDTFFDVNYGLLTKQLHIKTNTSIAMALRMVDDNSRYGGVDVSNGYVIDLLDQKTTGLINAGCYYFIKKIIEEKMHVFPDKFSFENDFLPTLIDHKEVTFIQGNGKFLDIGIPEDYLKAREFIN